MEGDVRGSTDPDPNTDETGETGVTYMPYMPSWLLTLCTTTADVTADRMPTEGLPSPTIPYRGGEGCGV